MAVVALVGVVSLSACSLPPPKPQFKLRIGLIHTVNDLPYFVMREQGFDKQNGLQFAETTFQGGAAIIEAMAADSVDVSPSVGSVPVLSAAARGLIPDKALAVAANDFADPDYPGVGVLVAHSINTWQDLHGDIGVGVGTSLVGTAVRGRLLQEGVRNYRLVEIPWANLGLAVAGGNVAAASMPEPWLTQSLLRGDGKLLGWVIGGPPFERIPYSLVLFRADVLKSNPGAVKAFLRAHLQAVKWIGQKPAEARLILTKALELSPEVGKQMKLLRWPLDARNDRGLLEGLQSQLVKSGILKSQIPADKLYDETLLNEVLAEAPR